MTPSSVAGRRVRTRDRALRPVRRRPLRFGAVEDRARLTRRVPAWAPLAATCLGQFMVVLDATIVNVALPAMRRGLHLSASDLQWVVNAYLLTLGGLILLGGRLGDHFG